MGRPPNCLPEPPVEGFVAALLAVCLGLTAPLLLIEMPPLLDYPNHLARLVALANPDDPFLSRFYAPNWTVVPDLGIDLVLPPLLKVLPVHAAGRLVIAVVIILPVLGTIALSLAVFGRRCWWSLGSGLVAWNQTALLGFLNFTAGIGLGLLLAASWVRWRDRNPRRALILAVLGTPAIFFCHLMGLVCFALVVGAYELLALRPASGRRLARLLVAAAPFALPLLLYSLSPLGDVGGEARFGGPADKLAKLIAPTENYVLALDAATAALIAAIVCLGVWSAARTRRKSTPPSEPPAPGLTGHGPRDPSGSTTALPAVTPARDGSSHPSRPRAALLALMLVAMLFVLAPAEFKGVHHFDTRFIIFAGFLLFACLDPPLPPVARTMLGGCFALRMVVLSTAWAGQATDLADLRQVIADVPSGSTVFLAVAKPDSGRTRLGRQLSLGEPVLDHLAAILPIERRAWWPFLFDNASQQPISTREPYRTLALRTATIHDGPGLATADLCGFDFVLILDFAEQPTPPQATQRLTTVAQAGAASLFSVRPGDCGRPAPLAGPADGPR